MTVETDDTIPMSGVELAARFDAELQTLLETIRPLSDAQLAAPSTPTAWSVKDHLAHLAAWAAGILELLKLTGVSRWTAMGLDPQTVGPMTLDEMNADIYGQHKDKSLEEVWTFFNETHQAFYDKIKAMSADDLARSYGSYDHEATGESSLTPIRGRIIGNSYHHYAEHIEWIREMMAEKGWG